MLLPYKVRVKSQKVQFAMFVPGKRPGHRTVAAVAAGRQRKNPLLFVTDGHSGQRFLVDTAAQISVIPASIADKQSGQSGPSLTAANCTSIRTFGTRNIPLRFSTRYFEWNFTVADVPQPLLGADFLRANNLLVDLCRSCLVDAQTYASVQCGHIYGHAPHLAAVTTDGDAYAKILADYPSNYAYFLL